MKKLGVNYWDTYDTMAIRISVRSLLDIASINDFTSRPIEFLLAFTQADIDMDVFKDIPLRIGGDGNRAEWLLKLNKSLYGLK